MDERQADLLLKECRYMDLVYKNYLDTQEVCLLHKHGDKLMAASVDGVMHNTLDTGPVVSMSHGEHEVRLFFKPSMSEETDFSEMFLNCNALKAIKGTDIDFSSAENLSFMFHKCANLDDIEGLKDWNISNVKDMSGMFCITRIESLEPLRKWDVSNVVNMSLLFATTDFNSLDPLSGWDVSKVQNMSGMFEGDSGSGRKLQSLTALKDWDVSQVRDMSFMFGSCLDLKSLKGLEKWDVSNVSLMSYMFYHCYELESLTPIKDWKIEHLLDMSGMFHSALGPQITNLKGLSSWDVSKVQSMDSLFSENYHLKSLKGLENWVINAVDTKNVFNGCSGLKDLGNLSKITIRKDSVYEKLSKELPISIKESYDEHKYHKSFSVLSYQFGWYSTDRSIPQPYKEVNWGITPAECCCVVLDNAGAEYIYDHLKSHYDKFDILRFKEDNSILKNGFVKNYINKHAPAMEIGASDMELSFGNFALLKVEGGLPGKDYMMIHPYSLYGVNLEQSLILTERYLMGHGILPETMSRYSAQAFELNMNMAINRGNNQLSGIYMLKNPIKINNREYIGYNSGKYGTMDIYSRKQDPKQPNFYKVEKTRLVYLSPKEMQQLSPMFKEFCTVFKRHLNSLENKDSKIQSRASKAFSEMLKTSNSNDVDKKTGLKQ